MVKRIGRMVPAVLGLLILMRAFPFVSAEEGAMSPEELAEEEYYDSLELLAVCVEAEAGNQDLTGKRMVVDVILNRVDAPEWPDTLKKSLQSLMRFPLIGTAAWTGCGRRQRRRLRRCGWNLRSVPGRSFIISLLTGIPGTVRRGERPGIIISVPDKEVLDGSQ